MKYKCIVGYKGREGVLSDHEVAFHIILKEEKNREREEKKRKWERKERETERGRKAEMEKEQEIDRLVKIIKDFYK